ncbi:hypothetical protein ACIQ57_07510 [Lysinibacillus xylanilyticus]|uniref:hypothetical protein n=1 Tax=Lysinibacillus xylanilyticus TaxID=582475 RepID=UPI00381495FB
MRKRSVSNKCFSCAKVQRQQQQSAQPERKSTPRFGRIKLLIVSFWLVTDMMVYYRK